MTSPTRLPPESDKRPPRLDRLGLVILILATLAGLWLGLAGGDISPVAPPRAPVPALALIGVGGGVGLGVGL